MVLSEKTINSRLVFQPLLQPASPHNWSAIDCKVKLFRTLSSADSQLSFPVYCHSFYLLTCKCHPVISNPPVSHAELAKLFSLSKLYQLVFSRGSLFQTTERRSYAKCSQRGAFLKTLVDSGQGVKSPKFKGQGKLYHPQGAIWFPLNDLFHIHTNMFLSPCLFNLHWLSFIFHSFVQPDPNSFLRPPTKTPLKSLKF